MYNQYVNSIFGAWFEIVIVNVSTKVLSDTLIIISQIKHLAVKTSVVLVFFVMFNFLSSGVEFVGDVVRVSLISPVMLLLLRSDRYEILTIVFHCTFKRIKKCS